MVCPAFNVTLPADPTELVSVERMTLHHSASVADDERKQSEH
jgi:hypothetical protein